MTVPNLLSIFRMGLVPLFIIALIEGRPGRAIVLFLVAAVTDALDGFIARFWGQHSHLGTYLDPAADKLLLVSAFVMLAIPFEGAEPLIPVWVAVLVIARDVLIVAVSLILYLALDVTQFLPAAIGKMSTGVQLATVLLVLLARIWEGFELAAVAGIYLTPAFAVASGFYYVYRASTMSEHRDQPTSETPDAVRKSAAE